VNNEDPAAVDPTALPAISQLPLKRGVGEVYLKDQSLKLPATYLGGPVGLGTITKRRSHSSHWIETSAGCPKALST
jgi:hypothetical protein